MISANCCGRVGDLEFGGNSMIVGPNGRILAKASVASEEVIVREIDLNEVKTARLDTPVFTQRRPEIY